MSTTVTLPTATGSISRALRKLEPLGPIAVVLIAWASTSVRDTMAIANVALVMAAVTVGVALIGWRGGLVTSIAAALSLNYFHTEPVHSLRITEKSDVIAVLLLATLGIAVSAATATRIRMAARTNAVAAADGTSTDLVAASSTWRPVTQVWTEALQAASGELALVDCKVANVAPGTLPAIARFRADGGDEVASFVLGEAGAVIPFEAPGLNRVLVLAPRHGMGALQLNRHAVTNFVEQLEFVLGQAEHAGAQPEK